MGYRDHREAQAHRVSSLELEVAEVREESAELRRSLAAAEAEIERLRDNPIQPAEPQSERSAATKLWLLRALTGASAVALVLLAVAAYSSERAGIEVATVAVPLCGATIGAWSTCRQPMSGVLLTALATGLGCFFVVQQLFATLWRRL